MKIALWCGLGILCIAAGHAVLGTLALLLLAGCAPVRREYAPDEQLSPHASLRR